jgi:hypothetical protein
MSKPLPNGPRTSIKEIPVCNDRLYREVGLLMKIDPSQVHEMAEFTGRYIAALMRKGEMEGVMLPYFGKFRPKEQMIKTYAKVKVNEANGMDLLYRAIKGKKLVDKRIKPENPPADEAI